MTMIAEQTIQTNRYPDYKDSGVDWLGEIPAHWETTYLKRFCDRITDGSHFSPISRNEGYNYISVKDIDELNNIDLINCKKISYEDYILLIKNGCQPKKNDILLTKDGTIGRAFIVGTDNNFVVLSSLGIITPNRNYFNSGYLRYNLISAGNINQMYSTIRGSALTRLTIDTIKHLIITLPPLDEQTRIAEFLDRNTVQIDQAIAQKERLIELLNERRQVMIHQAITRGLDPNVPMKESGIDWIGEIPAQWELSRINWLFVEKDETGYPNLPLLIVSINSGVTIRDMDDNENRKQLAEDFNIYKRTLAGDIAFNKMRMWQGAVGVVPQDGLVSPDYVVARPNHFVDSAFYGFLFKTREYLAEFIKHSHGIAWDRNRLYWDDFKNIFAVVPPLEEQNRIVEFLDAQQKEITFATKLIQRQIQKLQELKSTLINSAVTGKIKV